MLGRRNEQEKKEQKSTNTTKKPTQTINQSDVKLMTPDGRVINFILQSKGSLFGLKSFTGRTPRIPPGFGIQTKGLSRRFLSCARYLSSVAPSLCLIKKWPSSSTVELKKSVGKWQSMKRNGNEELLNDEYFILLQLPQGTRSDQARMKKLLTKFNISEEQYMRARRGQDRAAFFPVGNIGYASYWSRGKGKKPAATPSNIIRGVTNSLIVEDSAGNFLIDDQVVKEFSNVTWTRVADYVDLKFSLPIEIEEQEQKEQVTDATDLTIFDKALQMTEKLLGITVPLSFVCD